MQQIVLLAVLALGVLWPREVPRITPEAGPDSLTVAVLEPLPLDNALIPKRTPGGRHGS